MIIVEGCDNAGKTTLVHKLSDELRLLTVLNRRRPKSLQDSWDYLIRLMPLASWYPCILDRFMAVSEPIYGPICRGVQLYDKASIRQQFEFAAKSLKGSLPLLIYCRPRQDLILNFGDRPQMDGVVQNAHMLIDAYDTQIVWLRDVVGIPVVLYDYEQREAYDRVLSAARAHLGDTYK